MNPTQKEESKLNCSAEYRYKVDFSATVMQMTMDKVLRDMIDFYMKHHNGTGNAFGSLEEVYNIQQEANERHCIKPY